MDRTAATRTRMGRKLVVPVQAMAQASLLLTALATRLRIIPIIYMHVSSCHRLARRPTTMDLEASLSSPTLHYSVNYSSTVLSDTHFRHWTFPKSLEQRNNFKFVVHASLSFTSTVLRDTLRSSASCTITPVSPRCTCSLLAHMLARTIWLLHAYALYHL